MCRAFKQRLRANSCVNRDKVGVVINCAAWRLRSVGYLVHLVEFGSFYLEIAFVVEWGAKVVVGSFGWPWEMRLAVPRWLGRPCGCGVWMYSVFKWYRSRA